MGNQGAIEYLEDLQIEGKRKYKPSENQKDNGLTVDGVIG